MFRTISQLENILLAWQNEVAELLPKIFLAILVLLIFVLLARLARRVSFKILLKTAKNHTDVAHLLSQVVYIFFMVSGILLAMQTAGLAKFIMHLLAGAGIVGIIAGFAFKDIASNLFAGLLLKLQNPYKAGDWVEIDGVYGVVGELGWITTQITTIPGQEVFVPNQLIYSTTFTNFSTFGKRRVILETGVSYGDDLSKVQSVCLDEVSKIPQVLQDEKMDFYFTKIDNSTYNFQLRFWITFTTNDDYQRALSNSIIYLKKRFAAENISIAYPVTTLDFGVKGGVNLFDKTVKVNTQS